MKTELQLQLKKQIRNLILVFIIFLVLSGVTAFPIETELAWCSAHAGFLPMVMQNWLSTIYNAVKMTNETYPYLSYGTDWLAFAHIVIATAFLGPLKDPVRNIWVIQFGMIACFMVFPLAWIAGPIRNIPFYWQLIDCSFGVLGLIPLYSCYKKIKELERIQIQNK